MSKSRRKRKKMKKKGAKKGFRFRDSRSIPSPTGEEEEERRRLKKMAKKKQQSRDRQSRVPGCWWRRGQIEVDGAENGSRTKLGFATLRNGGVGLVCRLKPLSIYFFLKKVLISPGHAPHAPHALNWGAKKRPPPVALRIRCAWVWVRRRPMRLSPRRT